MKKIIIVVAITLINFITVMPVFARVTPEDIVHSQREAYKSRVVNYSAEHKQKLEQLSANITRVNKTRTDDLERNMETQAAILDEYERRANGKNAEGLKKARYWITYAHEAIAYQAAKIYIFNLSGEKNIKNDALSTIGLFQSDLNSARTKAIGSQKVLQEVISK